MYILTFDIGDSRSDFDETTTGEPLVNGLPLYQNWYVVKKHVFLYKLPLFNWNLMLARYVSSPNGLSSEGSRGI